MGRGATVAVLVWVAFFVAITVAIGVIFESTLMWFLAPLIGIFAATPMAFAVLQYFDKSRREPASAEDIARADEMFTEAPADEPEAQP